nr:tryptophan 2,3-dioxygenase family protein [uncultured Actinoplanes sp.]
MVRAHGKKSLPPELVDELQRHRSKLHGDRNSVESVFLDCVLDKVDGRYHYSTYLALPLFARVLDAPGGTVSALSMSRLLVADAARFEIRALHHRTPRPLRMAPRSPVVAKRVHLALRYLHGHRRSSGVSPQALAAPADALLDQLPGTDNPVLARLLATTVLPVDTLHDEYLFLRVLQAYELTFAGLAARAGSVTAALRDGRAADARAALDTAAASLEGSGPLFSMLATMNTAAFREFRQFTEGASAIQSERYKRFELACGSPEPDRFDSAAFHSVPAVRDSVPVTDTITDAYLDGVASGRLDPSAAAVVSAGLARLERAHQHWKSTHHSLAGRALGDAGGSGYTAGVPYLKAALNNRLFWRLGDLTHRDGDAPAAPRQPTQWETSVHTPHRHTAIDGDAVARGGSIR